ncbi:MAG: nucleotidyltransferase domain-containing protein, partial [Deltaproteobacteria bacterium]|nr:nucleotidyltransferase domain-containing protein [Deltaproteobacteria bacterium]
MRFLDRDRTLEELKISAMKLKESFPEVEDVLLFGSLVRDDYGADSDADVLIILKGSRFSRFFDRIPDFVPFFSSVSVSV